MKLPVDWVKFTETFAVNALASVVVAVEAKVPVDWTWAAAMDQLVALSGTRVAIPWRRLRELPPKDW